ncbi:MAG: LD-carboxypeptidase [Chitinophagaceae bacterium]
MSKIPPYLKKGDSIGIIAPAGFMPLERMQTSIDTLQDWGYQVITGATTQSHSQTYFSGSDAERLDDFQKMLDDKNIKAIFCARGGYGISRIIDQVNFSKFRKRSKWIIGYSDITILHSHIYRNFKIASLHAPMAAAFNDGEFNNQYILSLKDALEGKKAQYECLPQDFNHPGRCSGELVGGNLSLLVHLTGTPSDTTTKNKILFLEDVSEYLYNIDRMFFQLKRSGKLKRLAGLIIGGFTDSKDTDRPFGQSVYEIIADAVKEYSYPVCFGFPVSHEKENYALKIGVKYQLRVENDKVSLKEI